MSGEYAQLHPAIDEHQLVHLTWIRNYRGAITMMVSVCSSIAVTTVVIPCEQKFPTCLRCIDIVDRFW